jgi:hypothetical protein
MNSCQIPFSRVVCCVSASRWHQRPSCPPLYLSFLHCISPSIHVIDLDPECRLNSHKIGVLLAIQNLISVGVGWGKSGTHATQWGETYIQYNAKSVQVAICHFYTQHNWISKKRMISFMSEKVWKLLTSVFHCEKCVQQPTANLIYIFCATILHI